MANTEKSAAELYREERKARLAKSAKKNSKKSISSKASAVAGKVISVVLVLALVIGCGSVVLNQSGILPRSRAAFEVGQEKVSEAEYSYYYQSIFNMYMQYSYYGYDIGFDSTKAPSAQEYKGTMGEIEGFPEDQTPTWADFLEYSAKERVRFVKAAKVKCAELGIELDEKDLATVQETIKEYDEYSQSASGEGSRYSLSAYLKASFGKGMNKKLFTQILEEQQLSTKLQEVKTEEYTEKITDKQVNKEYNDNLLDYAVIDYKHYSFNIPEAEKDEEGNEIERTDKEIKKYMAEAKAKAEAFKAAATLDTFDTLAYEAAKAAKDSSAESYKAKDYTLVKDAAYADVSYNDSDEKFLKWAYGESSNAGETYMTEAEDEGYTVYMLVSPVHKAADKVTYDSRHILINFKAEEAEEKTEETSEGEEVKEEKMEEKKEEVKVETLDVSAYDDVNVELAVNAETAKDKAAYKEVQDILKEYLDGEHTAEAFGELANKYSADTGSNTNGGLYEATEAGKFVAPYDTWCLEEGRKEGDIALVEYDGSNYQGYHIIYFIKSDVHTWDDAVKETLSSEKVTAFVEDLLEEDIAKVQNENEKAQANVDEFLADMIRKQNSNASAQEHYEGDGHNH